MSEYKYQEFDDWFLEIENYGTRAERFYESLESFHSELGRTANGLVWLQAAFECGRMMKDKDEQQSADSTADQGIGPDGC